MCPSDDDCWDRYGLEEWRTAFGIKVSNFGRIETDGIAHFPRTRCGNYLVVRSLGTRHRVHNVVAEAFLPPRPSPEHTIDHIDRNPLNNRADNLRWSSRSEQLKNRKLPLNRADSKPVEVNTGHGWIRYPSINEAIRQHGFNPGSFCKVLKGKAQLVNGASARYADDVEETYPDEEWKETSGRMVSNMGRVQNCRGLKYKPLPGNENGYCKAFEEYVHILVMNAFGPPKPFPDATIDHINGVRHDNRISNLRWASKALQTANQKQRKPYKLKHSARSVKATFPDGCIVHFASIAEAQRKTGADSRRISEIIHAQYARNKGNIERKTGIRFE